jgi:predicted signal transduction protein with EAL and GGDEF domain
MHDTELLHRVLVMADELRRGVNVQRLQLNIEIRVGIAEWRAPHVPIDDLLRQADVALVEAKARNSQAVVYEPGHDAEHRRRITLVAELRRAIADESLTLAYQPLVDDDQPRASDARSVAALATSTTRQYFARRVRAPG